MKLTQPPGTSKYDVLSSDTIASISLRYNTTPSELSRLNKLSTSLLWPGQTLFVPDKNKDLESLEGPCSTLQHPLTITTAPTSLNIAPSPPPCRELTLSPDSSLERLLKEDVPEDEISRKYLRIKSKYVTDGQGVVSGVLLITKQTVMFNPDVSDHLVMDRGRDVYVLRFPLKAISRLMFFEDIAAMVTGDNKMQYFPTKCRFPHSGPVSPTMPKLPGVVICQETGKEYTLKSHSEDNSSNDFTCNDFCRLKEQLENLHIDQIQDNFSSTLFAETCSYENTVENSASSEQPSSSFCELTSTNLPEDTGIGDANVEGPQGESIVMEDHHSSSTPKHCPNEPRNNTKNYDISQKNIELSNENGGKSNEQKQESDVEGSEDTSERSAENTEHCGENTHDFSDVKSHTHLLNKIDDTSKDSGFSDTTLPSQDAEHLPLANSSSLSKEVKQWLGKRGVKIRSLEDEDSSEIDSSIDLNAPRPALKIDDPLMYVSIKIHKRYWCPNRSKFSYVMGIPPNRDLKRHQHWFALPKERVDQLYEFLTHWAPNVSCESSGVSTPSSTENENLDIVDNKFSCTPPGSYGYQSNKTLKKRDSLSSIASSSSSRSDTDEAIDLLAESTLLSRKQLFKLARKLPSRTVGHSWALLYSTQVHGISLTTLYRNFQDCEAPTLIVCKDENQMLFGAFLSEPPKISDGFYGTGESLLYSFKDSKVKVYHWTGNNNFFIKGSKTSLAIGGGDGVFGLWLDEDLYRGRSHSCRTFENITLSQREDFICSGLEAWAFI